MPLEMDWKTPGKVLHLKMCSNLSYEDFIEIDRQINERLQECDERIVLIVDVIDARISPYSIEQVKPTQKYLNSDKIARLLVVDDKKFNRLAMLLLFNLCRPRLVFCDNYNQAQRFLGMSSLS